ncbi:protein-disulfide reductase DsbD family protein [Sunxiuqinia elliptica]|uniref:Thiol:disulfide interchange protein DsbD n=1 Tax=Sunxiuqinia elliptica TaxID=655355 RepID=A0A4R6HC70_9BACT|nr:thioredoxin family protein [Sunxiuqinia elliptica]TDO05295.1 thiol:disulfide interchange protein DsbD [Sunxiuqinia elliptica]TDO64844.1 thiol:disulfide interchange protein DsbD [Sunxiuqinia elliptica]
MTTKRSILSIFFLLFAFYSFAQILEPVKWSFDSKQNGNEVKLIFKATIEDDWHLYDTSLPDGGPVPTSINFEDTSKFELVGELEKKPKPTEKFDQTFQMDLRYFDGQAELIQTIRLKTDEPLTIAGYVEFMCCNDETCLPPTEADFSFSLNGADDAKAEAPAAEQAESDKTTKVLTDKGKEGSTETLWLFFFFSFLAGLAAILTPCVFPMIPMTVSFFMHSGESKIKARLHAAFYGFSIIAIYTIVGTLVAVLFGPDAANWLSTHWLPNTLFFIIFMVFAFSFFGMFEIVLPSWLVNKSDKQVDKGGFLGSFFMALTLVLVSFSCTGPIVGAILVESAGGEVLKPIIGMFGFALAFALPFTLFALFPGWLSNLPKSGGWLNSVKVVLGFLELALGLKFLSIADQTYHWGILDREVYLALWIVIFTLMGFYLLGKLKFSHDSETKFVSVPRLMMAIATFSFVIYLVPGMFGAPLKAISGYLPPQTTHDFDLHKIIRDEVKLVSSTGGAINHFDDNELCEEPKFGEFLHLPHGLEGYFDFEQGMACAKALNKPVFIDFTGHGCVNCREMEAAVWSDPRVLERLKNDFVIIALYVDDKSKLPEEEWVTSSYDGKVKKTLGKKYADFQITRFGVNAQPYYVLMDTNEDLLVEPKAYDLNPDNFVRFLDEALEEFKKRQ